ncbi:hypothetical protein GCAAIG_08405 [Candidatus Electronema halotolerans]
MRQFFHADIPADRKMSIFFKKTVASLILPVEGSRRRIHLALRIIPMADGSQKVSTLTVTCCNFETNYCFLHAVVCFSDSKT